MYALTVDQPFADAIVRGMKPYENRSWSPPKAVIGQVIAVHASARKPLIDEALAELWPDVPDEFYTGAIVGTVRIVDVVPWRRSLGPWATGPLCWRLADARELPMPIFMRGFQRLWHVDAAIAALVTS